MNTKLILGIESSCDDTAAAVIRNDKILANITATQAIHEKYGGVVPELASRAHQQNIVPVINAAIEKAGVSKHEIDAIAYTIGPGLLGSLLVGGSFARAMAMGLNIPIIPVNHMQAHILAHFIQTESEKPQFPFLCLTVSGGHTQIVKISDHLKTEVIGETLDDAAGEAFDKTAKILGLPYPGGPMIDQLAQKGNAHRFKFTEPKAPDLNYSFSGLKTNILYFIQKELKKNPLFIDENLNDICASVQETIINILFKKLILASSKYRINQIAIAGGVSANSGLRKRLEEEGTKRNWEVFIPPFEYCTDNAAMIAITGYFKLVKGETGSYSDTSLSRMPL